ncbi:MAG: hypothetical protein HFE75_15945 [Firmicutes bacterium]|nr:hypothetical protein [Bacillota bacterium]
MNPFTLLLLAAATGGGRISGGPYGFSSGLDSMLDQLHGAVNALEKVNELRRMGGSLANKPRSFSPPPASAHVPASTQPIEELDPLPAPATPAMPNIDLQGAMQALGPILSMLGNNQNSR